MHACMYVCMYVCIYIYMFFYESCSKPPALDRRLTAHFYVLIQVKDLLQTRHGASTRKGERKGISIV